MLMMYFTWGLSEQAYMVGLTKYICIRTKKNKITTTFGGNLEQGEFDRSVAFLSFGAILINVFH